MFPAEIAYLCWNKSTSSRVSICGIRDPIRFEFPKTSLIHIPAHPAKQTKKQAYASKLISKQTSKRAEEPLAVTSRQTSVPNLSISKVCCKNAWLRAMIATCWWACDAVLMHWDGEPALGQTLHLISLVASFLRSQPMLCHTSHMFTVVTAQLILLIYSSRFVQDTACKRLQRVPVGAAGTGWDSVWAQEWVVEANVKEQTWKSGRFLILIPFEVVESFGTYMACTPVVRLTWSHEPWSIFALLYRSLIFSQDS